MAVILKSRQEISHLREAGRLVAETFEVLRPHVVPGTTTEELDKIAEDFLLSRARGRLSMHCAVSIIWIAFHSVN